MFRAKPAYFLFSLAGTQYLRHLWHHVVQIAGPQHDKHVEWAALHQIEHVILGYDLFFNTWAEVVENQLSGDSLDRLLSGGIDFGEYHLVEQTQRLGKIAVEITGAGIQMRLEDGRNLAILIQLTDTFGTLIDFFGMVGIVTEEYQMVGLDLEVETAIHTAIGHDAIAQLLGSTAGQLGHRHSGNAILNVNGYRLS